MHYSNIYFCTYEFLTPTLMLLPVQLDQQEMKAFLEIVLTIKWAYVLMFSEALYDLTYSTGH